MKVTEPTPFALAVGGADETWAKVVSVVVKRTYRLDEARGLVEAEEQLPLSTLVVDSEDLGIIVEEADVYPAKPLTDVVVRGHVHAPRGPVRELIARVGVGDFVKELVALGKRRVIRRTSGALAFEDPAPFEKIALVNKNAYGGYDRAAEANHGNPYAEVIAQGSPSIQGSRFSPYRYPRNGVGKGYLVEFDADAVDALELPNLEDPAHRLTPERLFAGQPIGWREMPLPWCTDWVAISTFPRVAYAAGMILDEGPVDDYEEARRGFMPRGIARQGLSAAESIHPRMLNGASLGLQLPHLTPTTAADLEFRLEHVHPRRERLWFRLPAGVRKFTSRRTAPRSSRPPPSFITS